MQLKIIKGDITTIECDAIVNSTSSDLVPTGAIDTAIHKVAGKDLAKACHKFKGCKVGNCVVTRAYDLPCHYVIHAVAPYAAHTTATHLLASCYKSAINIAIEKQCSSIAFPLIGSGHKGFSVEKALAVALFRINACMRDIDYDEELLIYLVLHNDEILARAKSKAKEFVNERYLVADDPAPIDEVPVPEVDSPPEPYIYTGENHWISLCRVNKPDRRGDIWMLRIADLINDSLVSHVTDTEREQFFDNRRLVFCNSGPDKADSIGFWEWQEVPKEHGPGWKSVASFLEDITPIEIIECCDVQGIDGLIDLLKQGTSIPTYTHDQVLFVSPSPNGTYGILCDSNDFIVHTTSHQNVHVALKETVYALNCYEISELDIICWENRKVYSKTKLPDPVKKVFIHIPVDAIRHIILERFMNWPVFKAKGISRSEWQKFKEFFGTLPLDTIYEELSTSFEMDINDVQECVSEFLRTVENYIDRSDIDSSLFIQLIENHEGFKEICSKDAYEMWKKEHQQDLDSAHAEIEHLKIQTAEEQAAASKQLLVLNGELRALEAQKAAILNDISDANIRFAELQQTISQQEVFGKQTAEAIHQKIADAQKDVSGFIADLSMFLPQSNTATVIEKSPSSWQYDSMPYGVYPEDDVDLAANWKDELNALSQNYAQSLGMTPEFSSMLSSFVYAAHINNMPLLIAGPGGEDIAEILSVTLYGCGAGQLTLGNEYDCDIVSEMKNCEEAVISIRNMFGKGWSDTLPQVFRKLKKQVVWTHPYVEDMAIEPKGLYNYMLPVFSECFVGALSAIEPWPGKRTEKFDPFVTQKKRRLRIAAFNQLKLSKLLLSQLEKVLSDTRELMNNPNADKDIEVLFGLIPLCVLTGRTDVLKEVIETETGISGPVKEEAVRYIEEE